MITPPTDIFWMVRVEGEAAESVANTLSPSSMSDIKEIVLISDDFNNDIQATITLEEALSVMKAELPTEIIEHSMINPLYVPSSSQQIDDVMDGATGGESMQFIGMDGNPFTMKSVDVTLEDRQIIKGTISCKPFELPSYNEIIRNQAKVKLN